MLKGGLLERGELNNFLPVKRGVIREGGLNNFLPVKRGVIREGGLIISSVRGTAVGILKAKHRTKKK